MKQAFLPLIIALCLLTSDLRAQPVKTADVPAAARSALLQRYPAATRISWEKEKGNFEANWGGASKEDSSVLFTPAGAFVEIVVAIPATRLPPAVTKYVKSHYPGAKITEAGRVTGAAGHISFEAEVKGKDLLFDEKGNFIKID
jgi:hypothetical protein